MLLVLVSTVAMACGKCLDMIPDSHLGSTMTRSDGVDADMGTGQSALSCTDILAVLSCRSPVYRRRDCPVVRGSSCRLSHVISTTPRGVWGKGVLCWIEAR